MLKIECEYDSNFDDDNVSLIIDEEEFQGDYENEIEIVKFFMSRMSADDTSRFYDHKIIFKDCSKCHKLKRDVGCSYTLDKNRRCNDIALISRSSDVFTDAVLEYINNVIDGTISDKDYFYENFVPSECMECGEKIEKVYDICTHCNCNNYFL